MNQQQRSPELSGQEEYHRLVTLLDQRRFEEALVRGRVLLEAAEIGLLIRAKTHNLLCWTFAEGLKRAAPEAVLHGEEAIRLARHLGERTLLVEALFQLASAAYQMSDYAHARDAYREAIALLNADPGLLPFGPVIAHQGLAQLELVQGNYREALAHLDAAQQFCQTAEGRFLLAELHRRRALLLLRLDEPLLAAEALSAIDEGETAVGPRGLWWKTHLCFTRARVELTLGHWATARPLALTALALARELGDMPVLAEATCLLALLEEAEGRKEAPRRARLALTYAIQSGRRDVVEDVRSRLNALLGNEA